ncbi:hypothetical protein SAMN05660841_03065 [Sphingobacterium nematocida]|uniref:Lipoprotein n=1 Tax=Sphingobacterium nematocida TaxID=1513896 RepID=A0A1T5F640_9SPHI|nr:hypothetical protein [Sphingobacterium nematocida]SKB91589.1 hypothetical protein SAMN05660841_03065 [Sphingobacterium nematocida]
MKGYIKGSVFTTVILIIISCNSNCQEEKNIKIEPLHPVHFEFIDSEDNLCNIDYFFLEGDFQINDDLKNKLKDFITNYSNNKMYAFNSVYIYKETEVLNKEYRGDESSFDGFNTDLIAYVRFRNNEPDIFYILEKGSVVFDLIADKEVDFEFEQ